MSVDMSEASAANDLYAAVSSVEMRGGQRIIDRRGDAVAVIVSPEDARHVERNSGLQGELNRLRTEYDKLLRAYKRCAKELQEEKHRHYAIMDRVKELAHA